MRAASAASRRTEASMLASVRASMPRRTARRWWAVRRASRSAGMPPAAWPFSTSACSSSAMVVNVRWALAATSLFVAASSAVDFASRQARCGAGVSPTAATAWNRARSRSADDEFEPLSLARRPAVALSQ
ncbi:hypothetical protein D7M15_24970 [Streptomyces sp. Z26]|nr:hypothetical protein D7M15_24970 [Streptomyces sp. Z26]